MAVARSDAAIPAPFAVGIALDGEDSIHITPHGELDVATAPELQVELDRFLGRGAARMVTLDLSRLSFIDSSGLKVVVCAVRESAHNGSRLRVLKGNPGVMHVFELTGLLDLFED